MRCRISIGFSFFYTIGKTMVNILIKNMSSSVLCFYFSPMLTRLEKNENEFQFNFHGGFSLLPTAM